MEQRLRPRAVAVELIIKAPVSLAAPAAYRAHGAGEAELVLRLGVLKEAAQTVASQNIVNGSFVNVQAFKFVKAIEITGVTGAVSFDHELGVAAPACAALLGSACCE